MIGSAHPNGRARLRAVPSPSPSSQGQEAPPIPTDTELIEAVLSGDQRIAAHLYDRLVGTVDRTLYRVFRRREADHDDLVQSAFEQIVLTLRRQKFARACSLNTWASSVAANVGLKALRSRIRERNVFDRTQDPDLAEEHPGSDGGRRAAARLELARVQHHLASMDAKKAEAVFLHEVLGYELAEISVLTGASVSAAQSRLVRGRKELMRRLERKTEPESAGDRAQ